MIWAIAFLFVVAFVIVRVSDHLSPEAKARRRRRRNHQRLTYKSERHPHVRFS